MNENILKFIDKYFPNKYKNITLHSDYIVEWVDDIKLLLYGIPTGVLFIFGFPFIIFSVQPLDVFYNSLFMFSFYISLVFIITFFIYFIITYYKIMYKATTKLQLVIIKYILNNLMFPFLSVASFFMIYTSSNDLILINIISGTYLLFIFFSVWYFSKYWMKIYLGTELERNKKLLKINNYIYDKYNIVFKEPLKPVKKKNLLQRLLENILYPIVGFIFSLPSLVAVSATGSLNGGEVYLISLIAFITIPFLTKDTINIINIYKFIKKVEKDENVIVYNGRW